MRMPIFHDKNSNKMWIDIEADNGAPWYAPAGFKRGNIPFTPEEILKRAEEYIYCRFQYGLHSISHNYCKIIVYVNKIDLMYGDTLYRTLKLDNYNNTYTPIYYFESYTCGGIFTDPDLMKNHLDIIPHMKDEYYAFDIAPRQRVYL